MAQIEREIDPMVQQVAEYGKRQPQSPDQEVWLLSLPKYLGLPAEQASPDADIVA